MRDLAAGERLFSQGDKTFAIFEVQQGRLRLTRHTIDNQAVVLHTAHERDFLAEAALFADTYGMTAQQRADLAPFAVDVAHRYHEDARDSAELDPVFRKLWENGAKHELPRAEAWLRAEAAAITAHLTQPG